jgi:hypothetical protein
MNQRISRRWPAAVATMALASAALAGCSALPASTMQQPGLSAEGGAAIAADITSFIGTEIRPANGPIALQMAGNDGLVGPVLAIDLQQVGYHLTDGPARHHLSYTVTSLSDGTVLRVMLDQITAGRLYRPVAGRLDPAGPFSVIDAGGGA